MAQLMPLVQLPTEPMPDFIVVHRWKENNELRMRLQRKYFQLENQRDRARRPHESESGGLYQWYGLNCLVLVLGRVIGNPGQRVYLNDIWRELLADPERRIWAQYSYYHRNPLHDAFRMVSGWVTERRPIIEP